MVRPTKKARTMQQLRRELGAALKLCPWVLVALLLVAVFWQADLAATTGLFQSPPTAAPPTLTLPAPPPTWTPAPLPTMAPTEPSNVEATVELTPTATVGLTPTATLEPAPSETPSPEVAATETVTPAATPEPTGEEGETRGRYAEGESGLRFDWGMLLDSVALGVSYLWLCCGVLILVGIPAGFAVLWSASRRRRGPSE